MGRPQTETADGVLTNQVGTSARVGGESLPWLRGPMNVPVERLNHGSSMQVGWATGTLLDFSIIFGKLSSAEQERIRAQVRREAERISNDGVVRSVGVFSAPKKPAIIIKIKTNTSYCPLLLFYPPHKKRGERIKSELYY